MCNRTNKKNRRFSIQNIKVHIEKAAGILGDQKEYTRYERQNSHYFSSLNDYTPFMGQCADFSVKSQISISY
jgi:hypothetical protein